MSLIMDRKARYEIVGRYAPPDNVGNYLVTKAHFIGKRGLKGGIEIDKPKTAWNLMPCKWARISKLNRMSNKI